MDVNATRTLNEISSSADNLTERINQAHSLISALCEKSFTEVEDNIAGLKNIVSQIDENNVSANNAIFSNITDRLAMFENSLKMSLEKQEDYVANSSSQLLEPVSYTHLHFPQPDKIEKIAKVLDVDIKDLFEFEHYQDREELVNFITDTVNNCEPKTLELIYKFVYNIKLYK